VTSPVGRLPAGLQRLIKAQLAIADRQDKHHCSICGWHLGMWYYGFPYPLCPSCVDHQRREPRLRCPPPARRACARPGCRQAEPVSPLLITVADGESRAARTWPDGAWSCPWCESVSGPGVLGWESRPWPSHQCGNPACIAGGRGSAADVAAYRARQAEETERARATAAWQAGEIDAHDRAEADRRDRCADAIEAARDGEFCYDCWAKSTSYGKWMARPVKIRHRDPENCPVRRSRRARV
jgi:hypothetical protein